MEFPRFTLGLRFAMTPYAALTERDCLNILLEQLPAASVSNMTLFGMWDDAAPYESERAYIVAFSDAPLKRAKALTEVVRANPYITSYLTLYRPLVGNNMLEKCGFVTCLGVIDSDGVLLGQSLGGENLRFFGKTTLPENVSARKKRVLIAPEAWGGSFTSADAIRTLMRAAARRFPDLTFDMQPVANGGTGTLDALVFTCNGRYIGGTLPSSGKPVRFGILPDRTIVLETGELTAEDTLEALTLPMNRGYTRYLLATSRGELPKTMPAELSVTILSQKSDLPESTQENVSHRLGIETLLNLSDFSHRLNKADCLIVMSNPCDDTCVLHDTAADTLLYHCVSAGKPYLELAFRENSFYVRRGGTGAKSLACMDLETAATLLYDELDAAMNGASR